jgi:hypothetical protein
MICNLDYTLLEQSTAVKHGGGIFHPAKPLELNIPPN